MRSFFIYILLAISTITYSQNKHLSIGHRNKGLCFGNSKSYNGVRLNFIDKNVNKINGLNISFFSKYTKSNGVKFSIQSESGCSNGVNLTVWGLTDEISNGLTFATGAFCDKINGFGIGLLSLAADSLNGVFISGIVGTTNWTYNHIKNVNGLTIGIIIGVQSIQLNGFAIGGYNDTEKQNGVVVGLYNETDQLHGLQFGVWNVAKNNIYFKKTPFINFNFRKENRQVTKE